MNLEELWKILDKERSSSTLQKLPHDFYEQVSDYIQELKDELYEMGSEDSKAALLNDELNTARIRIESIFNKRIGKIINLASSKVGGLMAQPNGLISKEKDVFEQVVEILEGGRATMLDPVLVGAKIDAAKEKQIQKEPLAQSAQSKKEDFKEEKLVSSKENKSKDYVLVRILKDIPTFIGVDGKNYTVSKEDVILLPLTNADVLCKRGVAFKVTIDEEQ